MVQPHELTASEQVAALREGSLGAVELIEHTLARIADRDPVLGAFVTTTPERALAAARDAEKAFTAARAAGEVDGLPPLLGVPTAIKDLAITAGVRTTFGSVLFDSYVPDVDDDSARLLAEAGAISVGKTATPEFGLPPYTEPAGRPPAVTPWDTTRLAGGSSGGAGAAVAGGLVPFAHGTDGGGSIRIPAAACGLVGLKTSRGLVSRGPVGGDPIGMSVSGPLARTVEDAALLLDALAVPVPGEPYPLLARPEGGYAAAARRADPRPLRIGRYRTPPIPGADPEPAAVAAYERATEVLTGLGHEVVEFDPGVGAGFLPHFEVLWAVLAHGHPVPERARPLLQPLTRWWMDRGDAVTGPQYLAATQAVLGLTRTVVKRQVAAGVDVVLTPMLALLPRPVGWFTAGGDPEQDYVRQQRFTPFTATYNMTGQPALSLPVTFARPADGPADGPELPVSVQLVGRAGDDALLLELGAQVDAATGRDLRRRPPAW